MKEIKIGTYVYNGETYNFNFYTSLSASDKITFVNSVVNTVVDDNYHSIIRDVMFDYMVIKVFTDIDTTFLNNSENEIDAIEQFLAETNIVDVVMVNADPTLFDQLNKAVDKAIEYRTGIHSSPLSDSLANLLSTLEKKIDEFDMGSMMEMAQKFSGMTGELTPESIINAYMNSDTHKKNVIGIEEAKKKRTEFAEDLDKAIKSVDGSKKSKSKKTNKDNKVEEAKNDMR